MGSFLFGIHVSELSYVLYLISRRGLAVFSESSRFTHRTSIGDLLGELGPSPFETAISQPYVAAYGF